MINRPKEKYLITRDRSQLLAPSYWNGISHSLFVTKRIHGVNMIKELSVYKNGRTQSVFTKKEWDKAAKIISDKLLRNKKYFRKLQEKISQEAKKINLFFQNIKRRNIPRLRFIDLINLAHKIKKLWLDYDVVNVSPWYIGGDKFKERIHKLFKLSHEDFLFLTTPVEKTEVSKLKYDLLKYSKLARKSKAILEKSAETLSEKYGWIPFGYDGPEYWDKDYFIKKLNKGIKNYSKKIDKEIKLIEQTDKKNLEKRNRILQKYKLNRQQIGPIDKINALAVWTDERKKLTFKLHYYYSQVLLELGKRYNIPYRNLKHLFTEELSSIDKNREDILKISNHRINNEFMIEARNGTVRVVLGAKKDKILKELEKQIKQTNIIKGIVASKGIKNIYQSTVKVLFSPKEGNKVKRGDFLVATMTTPDYIISMKKAAGFITDEGGVTCHAAIVAREMNKPCIIGTKIATKVLKDGDKVLVDANKGIVKIIKKR